MDAGKLPVIITLAMRIKVPIDDWEFLLFLGGQGKATVCIYIGGDVYMDDSEREEWS